MDRRYVEASFGQVFSDLQDRLDHPTVRKSRTECLQGIGDPSPFLQWFPVGPRASYPVPDESPQDPQFKGSRTATPNLELRGFLPYRGSLIFHAPTTKGKAVKPNRRSLS